MKHPLLGRLRRFDDGRFSAAMIMDCDVDCEFIGECHELVVAAVSAVLGHAFEVSLERHFMFVFVGHLELEDVKAVSLSPGGTSLASSGKKMFEVVGVVSHVSDDLGSDCHCVSDIAVELIR